MVPSNASYHQDFHAWTQQQAQLLRQGQMTAADWEHIAEEIETLGVSERRELESRLRILLLHLLKWQYQPMARSSSWIGSIDEQRDQLDTLLRQSPSLRRLVPDYLSEVYPKARRGAARETDLTQTVFPDCCPYTEEQVLDAEFWPDAEIQ